LKLHINTHENTNPQQGPAPHACQMLATTIHKSNTTPHHQNLGRQPVLSPVSHTRDEEIAGLLSQSPIVCLMISSPPRAFSTKTSRGPPCLSCTRTTPTTGAAHLHDSPTHVGGPGSRGAP